MDKILSNIITVFGTIIAIAVLAGPFIAAAIFTIRDKYLNIGRTKRLICIKIYATDEERKRLKNLKSLNNKIIEDNLLFLSTADVHTKSYIKGTRAFLFEERNKEIAKHNREVMDNRIKLNQISSRTKSVEEEIKKIEDRIYEMNKLKMPEKLFSENFNNINWNAVDMIPGTQLFFSDGWYITQSVGLSKIPGNSKLKVGDIYHQ